MISVQREQEKGERLNDDAFLESVAMCDEVLFEKYLGTGALTTAEISAAIRERKIFPCFFGSALKLTGVDIFLKGILEYMIEPEYTEEFGAKVYKIARDEQGNRLTYLKVTGGKLEVKGLLSGRKRVLIQKMRVLCGRKINQIRLYSGAKYETTA